MCTEASGGSSPPRGHLGTRGTSSEGGLRPEHTASVCPKIIMHRRDTGSQAHSFPPGRGRGEQVLSSLDGEGRGQPAQVRHSLFQVLAASADFPPLRDGRSLSRDTRVHTHLHVDTVTSRRKFQAHSWH